MTSGIWDKSPLYLILIFNLYVTKLCSHIVYPSYNLVQSHVKIFLEKILQENIVERIELLPYNIKFISIWCFTSYNFI